jgi:2Fe-2S ferredoxin
MMIALKMVGMDGVETAIDGTIGHTLMEVLRARDAVEASCGGQCACATCHVYIDDAWLSRTGTPSETEMDLLDSSMERRSNSRLSCQIVLAAEHEGLSLTVAPPEG